MPALVPRHLASASHSNARDSSFAQFSAHCSKRLPSLCHSIQPGRCRTLPVHPVFTSFHFILSFWCARSITYCVFCVNCIKIIHGILQSHPTHSWHSAQEYPLSSCFLTVTCDTVFLCRFSPFRSAAFSIPSAFRSLSILFFYILFLPWFSLATFLCLLHK